MRQQRWMKIHPKATIDMLGYVPQFFSEDDPRPVREQIAENYISGWNPMQGFRYDVMTGTMHYPGDPPYKPMMSTMVRDEMVVMYHPGSFFAIIQADQTFEIARLD